MKSNVYKKIAKKFMPKSVQRLIIWLLYSRDVSLLYRHRLAIIKGEKIWDEPIKKLKKKTKIKVGFVLGSASYWVGDLLYNYFANDNRFEPFVIIIPFFNGTDETIQSEYERALSFFLEKEIPVIGTVKDTVYRNRTWKECGEPDIVYYANPHMVSFPIEWRPEKLPANILTFYIPYGFLLADITQAQFNQEAHHMFWRIFCESNISKQLFSKYSDIGDRNVVFSGYPKMDAFYGALGSYKWKGAVNAKKFIYSPHHSLCMTENGLAHSTFKENYKYMIELAKKYSKTTSWIFRPHPFLEKACIKDGMFTKDEWYDYIESWNALPNGETQISGDYTTVFQTCDGIINDSVSYLAEILYVHKPMLYLKSEEAAFNDFGKSLEKIHYTCAGNDYKAIEEFIKMIMEEDDPMKADRELYFNENLNYMKSNGMTASCYIYKYVKEAVLEN